MKKKLFILIPIVLVFVVLCFFAFKRLYYNYRVRHAIKIVELSSNKVEVYKKGVQLSDLIKEINGDLLNNPSINTNQLGKQKIKFQYINEEKLKIPYEVEIEIVDTTPPLIFQSSSKTIYTDYDGNLEEDLFCGDIYDPNPTCVISGEYDTKTPGSYALTFTGIDSSSNEASSNFTLNVRERVKGSSSGSVSYDYTFLDEVIEKYKKDGNKIGIDISHWQGDINFSDVKEAGIEFVYIRVGRGDGIGEGYVLDDKFEQNIKGFNEVGIPVGVYFYSYASSKKDAISEAKWIIDKIKNYKVDLEVVFDWENWGFYQAFNLSFHDLTEMSNAFYDTLGKSGYKGMLYSSKSYLESVWLPVDYGVWMAHYTEQSNYQGPYAVWQLCDDGYVPGIDGYVDLNIRYEK